MRRNRPKQMTSLEERLTAEAARLRERARLLPPGLQRQRAIRLAQQSETAIHINDWLRSPGLRAPT